MEHLKLFAARLNVPQLIRVCEEMELWKELTFLYVQASVGGCSARVGVCGCVWGGGCTRAPSPKHAYLPTHPHPPRHPHTHTPHTPPIANPVQYDEYDNALMVMVAHSPLAWEHVQFKDVAVKVKAADSLYKGISFYLQEHPDLLCDLLKVCVGGGGGGGAGGVRVGTRGSPRRRRCW